MKTPQAWVIQLPRMDNAQWFGNTRLAEADTGVTDVPKDHGAVGRGCLLVTQLFSKAQACVFAPPFLTPCNCPVNSKFLFHTSAFQLKGLYLSSRERKATSKVVSQ